MEGGLGARGPACLVGPSPMATVPFPSALLGVSDPPATTCPASQRFLAGGTLWEVDWPGWLGIELPNFQSPNQDTQFGRDGGTWGQYSSSGFSASTQFTC